MRFDDRLIEEIKSRLRLSDVIGKSVKLKRQGREHVGLSPFTREKTPSFFVNDDKGFWHDFSSGKHGDLISFLQETERLSFPEAVERLAAEAGVALPAPDAASAETEARRRGLRDWLELASQHFQAALRRPEGAQARRYLEGRGLAADQWGRFGLGYAPAERTRLKDALVQRGARPTELVEAGLLIAPEGGGAPYDRFRDRIMFPITDGKGRIVSFGGRALNSEERAKYLNGPETELFHKGRMLYGLAEARRLLGAAEQGANLVVVEGYMDVLACQRAGVAAVAPLGTALTEEQMELLWRHSPEPVLCFDGDKAGLRAAFRVIDRALPLLRAGRSFRFALLGGGQDPDDILRERGVTALRDALSQTTAFDEVLFARERDAEPLDTPERRAGLKSRLRAAAAAIADRDLSDLYRKALLARFDALLTSLSPAEPRAIQQRGWRAGRGEAPAASSTLEGRKAAQALAARLEPLAAALAQGALLDPPRVDDRLEDLARFGFGDPALEPLAKEFIRLRLSDEPLDSEGVRSHLARSGLAALMREVERAALNAGAPFLTPEMTLADARTRWSLAFDALSRVSALEEAMASGKAEDLLVTDPDAFRRIKGERDALRRAIRSGTIWGDGLS